MKIEPNVKVQPQDIQETAIQSDGAQSAGQPQLDSLEGPTGQVQQALRSNDDGDTGKDFYRDWNTGSAVMFGAGSALFGVGLPFAAMVADPSIVGRVGDMFDGVFDWFGGGIENIGKGIGGIPGDAIEWLGGAISDTPEALGDAIQWTGEALWDATKWTGEAIGDGAGAVVNAAADVAYAAGDAVSDAVDAVGDAIGDVFSW